MTDTPDTSAIDQAVASGGAYEVLHKRLTEQGSRLRALANALNMQRLEQFGSSKLDVIGRLRVRTENNCVARDIVQVGDLLLFGYNVFIGLKKETRIEDVFSLYRLVETPDGYDVIPVDIAGTFLSIDSFAQDFRELYAYYKNTHLLQLMVRDGKLLASFQIGERLSDIRVFRWSISPQGEVRYIDNRGERDVALPAPYDFEWQSTTRDMVVNGRHPHLNILDTVFVETVGGDLTIKIENNTEDGLGIYREPVQDKTQSLDDAQIQYAKVGSLILLRVLPYREEHWRHLAYNTLTRRVQRIDALGLAAIQLPEDHGIIWPGGYLLQNGETRQFDSSFDGMRFKRAIRSPNGEDVLYVFHEPASGRNALFTYNLIERSLQAPLLCHGYARLEDGRMVIFSAESTEPTRVHPMQVWQTPFCFDEYAARQPAATGFLGRIGNAELVRGISDLLSLASEIGSEAVSVQRYTLLVQSTRRMFDAHHWIADAQAGDFSPLLHEIATTGEAVLDEYEKVESIRAQSERAMREATTKQNALLVGLNPDRFERVQDFVAALQSISAQRGHLLTIRELRYIDVAAIDAMEAELIAANERIGTATGNYLADPVSLKPLDARLAELDAAAQHASTVAALREPQDGLIALASDLDLLSELMATLRVDDATQRTAIVEAIAELYARLNQARARAEQRRRQLGSGEQVAQFGAQFALFSQSIASALSASTDPERCDEHLARLLIQLEELESQFGEHARFLDDILQKREELTEAFETHKQSLLDARQRTAQTVFDAARRILDGLPRRTARFTGPDELNAFFAGDALILKLRELASRLRELKDSVKADDVDARLKGVRDQAVRALRDKTELFEDGGNLIRLGRHRFSVNTQELDLTLLPRDNTLALHLTGTDYFTPLNDPALEPLRPYWQAALESESPDLSRAEYLAGLVLEAADRNTAGFSREHLAQLALEPDALARAVRDFATPRYREGYEKGIHDHDAALILRAMVPLRDAAGALVHSPQARTLALLCRDALSDSPEATRWPAQARNAAQIHELFRDDAALVSVRQHLADVISTQISEHALPFDAALATAAAAYLVQELSAPHPQFSFSRYAEQLAGALKATLDGPRWSALASTLEALDGNGARFILLRQWLHALISDAASKPDEAGTSSLLRLEAYVDEAAALILLGPQLPHRIAQADLDASIPGLLSEHQRIVDGTLDVRLFDLMQRLADHRRTWLAGFQQFQQVRHDALARERDMLRLEEFKPRPLASFVRNKLINDVYLPIIGDNLAKQMGTAGENKRSDLMGLLMLISPPGYGKTTLMEYVANRLGLVFMKINGPALGHEVRSLDPAQAPDATARQELVKLNLALEMGSNVMLYVDDIQHTHPEFLQKFISLCDGTRRIEGVWNGRTKTYDMRGKKFCVVMAGNPYTESGEVFKIPDMLANRADIYNLGDVLGGMEDAFTLSYIENSLTSNPVLAPMATRDMADLYLLVEKAQGRDISTNELKHDYSSAEVNEIVETLKRLIVVRDVVYRVNQQYIASAAQADAYRTEPAFKLQGSYRNMNKLAEKISSVMNTNELQQLIADHYLGESQLLTTGAEENLLKLAELRGTLSADEAARWEQIKADFRRNQSIGGADADTGSRVVAQLHDLVQGVRGLRELAAHPNAPDATHTAHTNHATHWPALIDLLERVVSEQTLARTFSRDTSTDAAMWLGGLRNALELGFKPMVEGMQKRADQHDALQVILREIARRMDSPEVPPSATRPDKSAKPNESLP
ncbi:DNA repair ATPase [Xanthomonadaceae bacterium JHOS43]|nr:DNA repair ATPase [Xanthomonadaceae bacterium JHOS43]